MILLDTHIWLWWLLDEENLSGPEKQELDLLASDNLISVSWVSVWETEMLERKNRIKLLPDFESWMKFATRPDVSKVLPADIEVVLAQRKLPESFHGDPADRLIAATSILSGYPLATHDQRIRKSGVCKIWK